jgi:hypothetical protein
MARGAVARGAAGGVDAATSVEATHSALAGVVLGHRTGTASIRIPRAAWITVALVASQAIFAESVATARRRDAVVAVRQALARPGIAVITRRTHALRFVVDDLTLGIASTRAAHQARVDAPAVDTLLVSVALLKMDSIHLVIKTEQQNMCATANLRCPWSIQPFCIP